MNFLRVNDPITELIKSGFHVLVEVMLDSMFPEGKKVAIYDLFTAAYKFLTRFASNNKTN